MLQLCTFKCVVGRGCGWQVEEERVGRQNGIVTRTASRIYPRAWWCNQ